jgi:hypothetical protein
MVIAVENEEVLASDLLSMVKDANILVLLDDGSVDLRQLREEDLVKDSSIFVVQNVVNYHDGIQNKQIITVS